MATTRKKKKRSTRKPAKAAARKPDSTASAQSAEKQEGATDNNSNKAASKANGTNTRKKVKRTAGRKKTGRRTARRRTPAGRKAVERKPVAGQTIHCTVALTGGQSVVLPTSAIAEITDYAPPSPLENAPEWLLGQVEWEDWQVPVISFGAMTQGEAPESATGRSRIMVVKSLSNSTRVPFIGVLVSEIPRLAKLSENDLEVIEENDKSPSVHCSVKLTGKSAVIPDLDRLGQLVGHAAYGTVDKQGTTAEA